MKGLLAALLLSVFTLVGCTYDENRVVNHTLASIARISAVAVIPTPFGAAQGEITCTGFVVAPHRVLTANHCVGENMLADGLPVKVIKRDEYYDLALLFVGKTGKAPLELRDSPVIRNEELFGVGYGFGWTQPFAVHESVMLTNVSVDPMQVSGIMVQGGGVGGMSGGPVVDMRGKVVSMNLQSNMGFGYGPSALTMRAFLFDAGLELPPTFEAY